MNKIFINNIGDLNEIQRISYFHLLYTGIKNEILNFENPFFTKLKLNTNKSIFSLVYLYPNYIKFKGPQYNIASCLKLNLSYTINFYVQSEYIYTIKELNATNLSAFDENSLINFNNYLKSKFLKKSINLIRLKQDICFGSLPLMTDDGTFIINGYERVVINQIVRSPGVYFSKNFGTSLSNTQYIATLISNNGLWTKIVLATNSEEKTQIYITIPETFIHPDSEEIKILNKEILGVNTYPNKIFIYEILKYFGLTLEEIFDALKNAPYLKFEQLSNSDFPIKPLKGKKLKYKKFIEKEYRYEMLLLNVIENLYINQFFGYFYIGTIGRYNINKKLQLNIPNNIKYLTAHDFLGIIDGLLDLKYKFGFTDDIDHIKNKIIKSIGELLQTKLQIGLYKLQKNLIFHYTSINYKTIIKSFINPYILTSILKDFFITSDLSQFMDQSNALAEMVHKRKVSLFGPNGLNHDHVSLICRDIHPSQYGRFCPIDTPEGQNAGLINALTLYSRVNSLGLLETPYFLITNNQIQTTKAPLFLNAEQENSFKIIYTDFNYNKIKTHNELLSVKDNYNFLFKKIFETQFILISSLQLLSLGAALIPFLEHDDANRALMGSNMQRQAVPLLFSQKAIVGTGLETIAVADSQVIIKSIKQGKVIHSSSKLIQIQDSFNDIITYYLQKYKRSNQNTNLNQQPIVSVGEQIYSNQIIADGSSTNEGELALGRNLLVAYMPWDGYNYEDAIVINERLIKENILSSIYIKDYEVIYNSNIDLFTSNFQLLEKYFARHLSKTGIIKVGSYVTENDILVGKLTFKELETSSQYTLLQRLIKPFKLSYQDTSLRVEKGTKGRVINISVTNLNLSNHTTKNNIDMLIKITIASIRPIQIGDKLSGRHGNKGIVSRILSSENMPYLPDGTPIDILLNPLGVPSRMNVGQIFESLLGLAGEKLGNRYKIMPFDEIYGQESSRILINQKLKEAAIIQNCKWLFNSQYPGKIFLKDGRTGEYFDNPTMVGKSYILKLIHFVEDKVHARSVGPYTMITNQPVAGKAQHGGQRFGEMEVWALEAYGCSTTLQEILTLKSDDSELKEKTLTYILQNKKLAKAYLSESFLTLIRELNALGLDLLFNIVPIDFQSVLENVSEQKDFFKDLESRLNLKAFIKSQTKMYIFLKKKNQRIFYYG